MCRLHMKLVFDVQDWFPQARQSFSFRGVWPQACEPRRSPMRRSQARIRLGGPRKCGPCLRSFCWQNTANVEEFSRPVAASFKDSVVGDIFLPILGASSETRSTGLPLPREHRCQSSVAAVLTQPPFCPVVFASAKDMPTNRRRQPACLAGTDTAPPSITSRRIHRRDSTHSSPPLPFSHLLQLTTIILR